jgi:hypothetical protein
VTPSGVKERVLDHQDVELLGRAQRWRPEVTLCSLSVAKLAQISKVNGLDFATAVLYDRIVRTSANAEFARCVRETIASNAREVDLVGIVPGAFYQRYKHTGADGKRVVEIARKLGLTVELLPLKSFGGLKENAEAIVKWLHSRRSKTVALVSLSKGSSDVKQALTRPDAAVCFENVRAWVSFSGIVQGTPLVDWLQSRSLRYFFIRLLLRLGGQRPSTLKELRWGDGAALSTWPALPRTLRVVHIYGLPLERHLCHPWAFRGYERLRNLGPNDGGGVLLGDLAQLPGITFPVWGADHYLSPAWDISSSLERVVLAALQRSGSLHATRSER